ncbi:MAG: PASTA domain-containing protein [Deltaproteobacteria bacterium]|nr:PASTA domain-containing protein [Deltaproteobacteria bacterium]
MKKLITAILFTCVIIMCTAGVIYAGALDRQVVQPRTNEATQSMIRVPGVVGQEQAYAMSALQQAGLNVSVFEAKKMPKGMEGAANMEGKVVSQTPGPGGMAMYGTAVSIYIWKPQEVSSEGSIESPGNTSGWGNNDISSYNQTQSTYSGTQAQPQGYQPMGTTGTTTQSSQPFQVQQYYYPSTGDGNASNQQGQPNQGEQPTDPNAYQQPVDPNTYQQPVDPNAYQQPVDPNTYQQPADANTTQQTETSEKNEESEQVPKEEQTSTPAE